MKNDETWEFAQKYCGKIWQKYGLYLLVVTFILSLVSVYKGEDFVNTMTLVLLVIQMAVMIYTIFLTEKELASNFDMIIETSYKLIEEVM